MAWCASGCTGLRLNEENTQRRCACAAGTEKCGQQWIKKNIELTADDLLCKAIRRAAFINRIASAAWPIAPLALTICYFWVRMAPLGVC